MAHDDELERVVAFPTSGATASQTGRQGLSVHLRGKCRIGFLSALVAKARPAKSAERVGGDAVLSTGNSLTGERPAQRRTASGCALQDGRAWFDDVDAIGAARNLEPVLVGESAKR